jgi:spore coat polysaccharide biosynthesis predicted glycosyltransferase SpsG/RimJ/RimL family protein N-acetyltransferase
MDGARALRVLIHCDGGPAIGVGHVMRSLALAEQASAAGHQVVVAGVLEGGFVDDLLAAARVEVVRLDGHDAAGGLVGLVDEVRPDVVHVDSYAADRALPVGGVRLSSHIEDGRFGRRSSDVAIDPNYGAEREPRGGAHPAGTLLRGSRYAPLRRAVTSRRGAWRPRDRVDRVLVVMGGADPLDLAPRVLELLPDHPMHVTVVARPERHGSLLDRVRSCAQLEVEVIAPVGDLPALMTQQDLVVSAAGTSVWELCCLGVPMALVCAVDNQRSGYERMVGAGAALGLGTVQGDDCSAAAQTLREAVAAPSSLHEASRRAAELVDGLGAWRIVRTWEELAARRSSPAPVDSRVVSRRATMADAAELLRWRNDEATRASSRTRDPVAPGQHLAWLEASLRRDDRLLLIGSDDAGDVGAVRWDRVADGEWEVSITVAPERRGEARARPLLAAGEMALREIRPEVATLRASVHADNEASRRLFAAAGYLPDQPADDAGFLGFRKPCDR